MAASLCATVFTTTLQPNRFANHTSTRVLPSTTIDPPSPNRNLSISQLLGFSPWQRSHVVASALSGSPGKFFSLLHFSLLFLLLFLYNLFSFLFFISSRQVSSYLCMIRISKLDSLEMMNLVIIF